ncbi:polymorphic toxin type 25 domain-containing protein, partial [Aeromonas simiae]
VGMDFWPYFPGLIPTSHDSSFDIGIGVGSLGISLEKDGVDFSLGVGSSLGWGDRKKLKVLM